MSTATRPIPESLTSFLSSPKQLLINGSWVAATEGHTFEVQNPATTEIVAHVAEGGTVDIDKAVKAARAAFDSGSWSKMTPSERGKLMWKLGDLIEKNNDQLAQLETLDNGKPFSVARVADVPLAADMFRYMAGWCTKIEGNTIPISVPYAPGAQLSRFYTSRTGRCGGADHSLEFSAADGCLETGAGVGSGVHDHS